MVPRFFGSQFWSSRVLRFKVCEILELQGNKIALLEVLQGSRVPGPAVSFQGFRYVKVTRVWRFKCSRVTTVSRLQSFSVPSFRSVPVLGLGKNGAPTPTQRLKPNCMALGSKTLNCKVFAAATHLWENSVAAPEVGYVASKCVGSGIHIQNICSSTSLIKAKKSNMPLQTGKNNKEVR